MRVTVVTPRQRQQKIQRAIQNAARHLMELDPCHETEVSETMLKKAYQRLCATHIVPPPYKLFRDMARSIAAEVLKRWMAGEKRRLELN